jgi:hypothetical protein
LHNRIRSRAIGMSLHNGIDTTAYVSFGVHSKTYTASDLDATADLYASFGMLENAPGETVTPVIRQLLNWFWEIY